MISKLYLRSYMMFVKWSSFATPKTELALSINLLLRTSLRVLVKLQITWQLYERPVKHAWADQNSVMKNHLDQCVEVQYLLNITSLVPELFSDDNNIGSTENRNSHINLMIDNTKVIDCYKNFIIDFFLFFEVFISFSRNNNFK